jgi:hypothetical protein
VAAFLPSSLFTSVIVYNFHVIGVALMPFKA